MPYRTIIIEDDSMVAAIDRQYVESDRRFQVQKTFKSGGEALTFLKDQETDLIILDYYTPAMTGLEFIDALHRLGKAPSIIMVTSASDADIVRALLSRGVLDYLVKPFAYERFQQALEVFCRRRESVQRDSFSQDALDHTLFRQTAPAPSAAPPKGLQSQTLARIEAYLRAAPDERHTSDEIASHVGLSVVTVRRYMNYLTDRQIIDSEMDYRTGGRPCLVYFLRQ